MSIVYNEYYTYKLLIKQKLNLYTYYDTRKVLQIDKIINNDRYM